MEGEIGKNGRQEGQEKRRMRKGREAKRITKSKGRRRQTGRKKGRVESKKKEGDEGYGRSGQEREWYEGKGKKEGRKLEWERKSYTVKPLRLSKQNSHRSDHLFSRLLTP